MSKTISKWRASRLNKAFAVIYSV